MAHNDLEIEVKFYLHDHERLERRLRELGAEIAVPRGHEINLRFDTPNRDLSSSARVLRLRQDSAAIITYKGPAQTGQGVSARTEIEIRVDDFSAARRLLEALGYRVIAFYEKYRAIYRLDGLDVTLDELPYGAFAEIEGPDAPAIQAAAQRLGLRWAARSLDSYLGLFARLCAARGIDPATPLSFDALAGMTLLPTDLGLEFADE